MKKIGFVVVLGLAPMVSQAADVYEFGQDQASGAQQVRVQKESGFQSAPAAAETEQQVDEAAEEKSLREDTGGLPGCEQSTRVGGYRVKAENNCDKDGKPLIRFGK